MRELVSLWTTDDRTRWFLIPGRVDLSSGVDAQQLSGFEVSEAEAIRWAREELGESLEELKYNILDKLDEWRLQLDEFNQTPLTPKTKVTPEAGSVFYEFLTALPKVFRESTSDDEAQIESARKTMADLERRFAKSGLNLHGRMAAFPERLAKVGKKSAETA